MHPHSAVIWILYVSLTRALSLSSLEEDRTDRLLQSRQFYGQECGTLQTVRCPLEFTPPDPDCVNLQGPPLPKCYYKYLLGWPLRPPGLACGIGDNWSECFVRDVTGQSGYKCTELDGYKCHNLTKMKLKTAENLAGDPVTAALLPDEVYYAKYVLATMENVYNLLSKMANVTAIVDRSDPVLTKIRGNPLNLTNPGDVDLGNYITALTLGLTYLSYQREENSTHRMGQNFISDEIYDVAYDFAQVGLRRSPALIEVMWPSDGSTLSTIDNVFAAGVANLFTNLQRFVAFTRLGTFNDTNIRALNKTTGLSLAAATLHTTTRLLQNGFIVVPDPVLVKAGSLQLTPGFSELPCRPLIDRGQNYGAICNSLDGSRAAARYWSSSTNRFYNFQVNITSTLGKNTLAVGNVNAKQILLDIWEQGYADMNLIFDGGYDCQINGYFGALLRVSSDGQMDFNCFSSLPMDLRGMKINNPYTTEKVAAYSHRQVVQIGR